MKRVRVLLAMIVAAVAVTSGLVGSPASAAYPSSSFLVEVSGGSVTGLVYWYNRSVGVTGNVHDFHSSVGGYTQARFTFYLTNSTTAYDTTTRTADDGQQKGFNFTEQGPVVVTRLDKSQVGVRSILCRSAST